ncbi:MAG: hypothetical protein QW727_01970 [Candidatus Pacearchaeota archaeon]
MVFLDGGLYAIILILHIIGTVVGVGAVTITDYFHVIGLKKRKLEEKLLIIYPILGKIILQAIALVIITGTILLANRPELIQSPLFQLKIILFVVILVNGFILHRHVFPQVEKCVIKKRGTCPIHVLWISSISGAISLTTWYGILILAFTKTYNYSVHVFLIYYFTAMMIIFGIAYFKEKKARIWKK